ncbi:voltage-gated monoatomic cation channel TMEM109 isoform X2 [Platichthys flesus]|uniref:voltage-gated monoatomic cation channel TMEM109 isoform X2 n=1 Tax=Platichthys flesus TaxID=8260 RepID=UPI002DBC30F5|nr:voltage-gated monoatomic cation channel TMEM109 isoform X2 [Platichthys flesus]
MARCFLNVCVLLLLGWRAAEAEQVGERPPPAVTLRTLLAGTCQEIHGYAESLLGTGVVRSAAEFFEMVLRVVAEGAASGLNVIAVYFTEILRVTGFEAALPRVTPEGVAAFAQWGLLALIGYWVLTIVLRLLIAVLRRVFWVVRTVLALWLFGLMVTDKTATTEATAVRLAGLVLVCALLTLLSSASEKSCAVEQRLSVLESRLRAVEKRKGD